MVDKQKTARILKTLTKREAANPEVMEGMKIPNHSGDNSAGSILSTPVNDIDIPNKKYVDDQIAAIPTPTTPTLQEVTDEGATTTNNMTTIAPTLDLHCATKKYVDDQDATQTLQTVTDTGNTTTNDILLNGDNVKLQLGASNDASITYDGTNLVLNPRQVGSGVVNTTQSFVSDNAVFWKGLKYALTEAIAGAPALRHVVSGQPANFRIQPNDRDGTDSVSFNIDAKGQPGDNHREALIMGYISSDLSHQLYSFASGTGTQRSIKMGMGQSPTQLQLSSDGTSVLIRNDSGKLKFGAGSDAYIEYDGTDMVIDPASVGSGGIKVIGDMFFSGTGSGLPYGEIYCMDNATETTISSSGVANKVQVTVFDTDGHSNNTTPDHTNDHITITKAGKYMVNISAAILSGSGAAARYGFALYKNNGATQFGNVHTQRRMAGGGGDAGSLSMSGIVDLAANDTVEVWVWNETNTTNLLVEDITLSITQVGG